MNFTFEHLRDGKKYVAQRIDIFYRTDNLSCSHQTLHLFVNGLLFLKKEAKRPAETPITVYHITCSPERGSAKVKVTLE
jgi:hypothetical protein